MRWSSDLSRQFQKQEIPGSLSLAFSLGPIPNLGRCISFLVLVFREFGVLDCLQSSHGFLHNAIYLIFLSQPIRSQQKQTLYSSESSWCESFFNFSHRSAKSINWIGLYFLLIITFVGGLTTSGFTGSTIVSICSLTAKEGIWLVKNCGFWSPIG